MSTARDALRGAALKSRVANSLVVEFEGNQYEVRAPSVRDRSSVFALAGVLDVDASSKKKGQPVRVDSARLQVAAVVQCTFVPGGDERLFELSDFEALLNEPAGGLVDALAEPALKFLNTSDDKDAAKKD